MTDEPEATFWARVKSALTFHKERLVQHGRAFHRLGRLKVRNWISGVTLLGCCVALFGFSRNVYDMQGPVCSARFLRPHLADFCGDHGWGNQPTHDERIAWEALPPGDCAALARYTSRFRTSPLNARAAEWSSLRQTIRDKQYSSYTRVVGTYVRQGEKPVVSENDAQNSARQAALADAHEQCAPSGPFDRLVNVKLLRFQPECRESKGLGYFCGADYQAECQMRGRREHEWCGPLLK